MYKQIKDLLEKFEVKEIDCLGKEFDPALEQAVVVDHDETKESGVVTVVLQKGYMYKDRVLRTAMFVIWLLPVILIALVSYLLYMNIKKNKKEENINKEKNIKVIHDFDDDK